MFFLGLVAASSFYELSAKKWNGDVLHFDTLRNKVVLVTNVASE